MLNRRSMREFAQLPGATRSASTITLGVVVAPTVALALSLGACSAASDAGRLDRDRSTAELAETTVPAADSNRSLDESAGADGARSAGGASFYGASEPVTDERRRTVESAVAGFVATLPGAQLVSTAVMNEAESSSAAMVVVVMNGARRTLAVSVTRDGDEWQVENVHTMSSGGSQR